MIIEAIKKRRSVREYKDKPVTDETVIEIIKAAQFAPTGRNNRLVEFIVVKDQATKEELYEITRGRLDQDFVKKAPVILILVSNEKKNNLFMQDLSIASAHVFLQAAELRLGTVWKNVFPEETDEIKELLNIPDQFTLINLIPIGYPETVPEAHSEEEFNKNKIHYDRW